MDRALRFLCLSVAGSAGAAYYAHWQQRSEKERMHQGVVRDMAREAAENAAAAAAAAARGQHDALAAAVDAAAPPPCEGGICALSVKRIRVE
jgi:hypothetical protein